MSRAIVETDVDCDRCRVCGCTDLAACDGGCEWIEGGLCSRCVAWGGYLTLAELAVVRQALNLLLTVTNLANELQTDQARALMFRLPLVSDLVLPAMPCVEGRAP